MGMPPLISTSSTDAPTVKIRRPGDPVPYRFEVLQTELVGVAVVALVRYPDCANYEGTKVLVYESADVFEAAKAAGLDPHFTDRGPAPFARFEPTERGWTAARWCAARLR